MLVFNTNLSHNDEYNSLKGIIMPAAKKPVKKVAAKKTVKKVAPKAKKVAKEAEYESFKLEKETLPFWSFNITRQTKYWIILLSIITVLQLWIILQGLNALNVVNSDR